MTVGGDDLGTWREVAVRLENAGGRVRRWPERCDRLHCDRFFAWYAHEHRHSGIGLHTPADVHYGRAHDVRASRGRVLDIANQNHPERFVRKAPQPP
jgi:hypothetical protein